MKRLLTKKLLAAGVVIAGILTFAGTCTIQRISLTTIGTNDVFAGEVHNDSGVSILDHNVAVAFIGTSYNLLETKTVQPCLRTLPTGGVDYFSAQSSYSAASVIAGLARVQFDSTFKVGTPAVGSGTITNLTVNRSTTSLVVAGTFQNTDSTTLTAPNACAVVYSSAGNVIVVGLDQSLSDLGQNASDTFSISLTVPDSTATVDHVNVYVDGYKNGVPILPIADTGNTVSLTPTATATPSGTPGAAAQLKFLTTIPLATHGASFGSVQVAIQDANGVTVTSSTANVTLSIESGTGSAGAVLNCNSTNAPITVAAVSGVATFTTCTIDRGGLQYHLNAASSGLNSDVSNGFNVTAGTVTTLAFTGGPANATSGAGQTIQVTQTDGTVNVWNDTNPITLAIDTGSSGGGTLTCSSGLSVPPSNGIATFTGCSISKVGTYPLKASKTSPAVSVSTGAITIFPVIVFTTQPSAAATSGVAFGTSPTITLRNGDGTTVTGDSTTQITLVLFTVSAGPGVLSGCAAPVTAGSGIVTFSGCIITGAGTYKLTASGTNLTDVNSTNIVVSP